MTKQLIITAIMLVAALPLGIFVVWPKYNDFQRTRLELKQKEAELNSKESYYSKVKDVWSRLDDYGDALARVDSAIPQSYSLPVLFNYFQQTANENGLIIENLTFGEAAEGKVKKISINLMANGSYFSLKSFLSAIESSERFFEVNSISLSPGAEAEQAFSFDLKILTYSY